MRNSTFISHIARNSQQFIIFLFISSTQTCHMMSEREEDDKENVNDEEKKVWKESDNEFN